jgi:hypothetical protein
MIEYDPEDLFRAWKLNRWPGGFPKSPDWSDVETAFRAGLFQGAAYVHFGAPPDAGCVMHGSAHPCEECAAEIQVQQERDDLVKALREARALLDHAGCPVGWLDKVLAGSAVPSGVSASPGETFSGQPMQKPESTK